jgi:hypothetical protein
MTSHAREDDAAPDADFEWVNAWAAARSASIDDARARTAPAAVIPATLDPEVTAAEPKFGGFDRRAAGELRSAAEPMRRAKRWTQLFRIITRDTEVESREERDVPMVDAPDVSALRMDGVEDVGDTMLDPDQIERDIAEIVVVRNRLLSEVAPTRGRMRSGRSLGATRTSDYVPILIGGVLAFTSLVVFGAAASFVSLR